ncbi:MAG: hypothetical protein M3Y22_18660 [Pseudomonadota bacterium]|nr:hypothetical protein [Pseudomonadota bacterium]
MKSIKLLAMTAVLAAGVAAPVFAQDAMMKKDHMMKMSKADTKKMASCHKMSHEMMMKNKGCAKMMKMHPDMMPS